MRGVFKSRFFLYLWYGRKERRRCPPGFHFRLNFISVSKQYVKNPNGELTLSRPKTETSVRKVSIPQEAIDLLIAEHDKHPDNPYMFPSPITGEMYYPDSIVR